MEIRFANPLDLEQVIRLEKENFAPEEQISKAVLETYLIHLHQTCLVMEQDGEIAGFILSSPSESPTVSDAIFHLNSDQLPIGEYLAIASLSVSDTFKGQGVGTLLLAALKEVAQSRGFKGIALTCKDYLIGYYEINHFEDLGPSSSQFGGQLWYDMYWKAL
ncbi:GNAT family N-acetyltransferase [Streptococcus suis]|nr:GNAT family N-acetyltransferase [Streptococcus suis]NQK45373.1 GNAT family N-acetyltransferase [Streptococcus suis]